MAAIRYFFSYATVNENPRYTRDLINFRNYARHDPGVDLVEVYIAVNQARPKSKADEIALQQLVKVLEKNPRYKVRKVEFFRKPGRDWRALYTNLQNLMPEAEDSDFLFFNNRSGTGALESGWYRRMVQRMQQDFSIGGVASTIWLPDPNSPWEEERDYPAHLQGFGIVTRIGDVRPMLDDFPGIHATESRQTIEQGEVAFSQRLLASGKKLASLFQPNLLVSPGQTDFGDEEPGCPRERAARRGGVPFSHRSVKPYYLGHPRDWLAVLTWWAKRIWHQPDIIRQFPHRIWMAIHWFQWHIRHLNRNHHNHHA